VVALKMQDLLTEEQQEMISSRVPDEGWEKLPSDGAENIDSYLYGSPKTESLINYSLGLSLIHKMN